MIKPLLKSLVSEIAGGKHIRSVLKKIIDLVNNDNVESFNENGEHWLVKKFIKNQKKKR